MIGAWIVLDCETYDAPPEAIEAAVQAWKAPCTWKPETVETKRQEAADRYRKNAALMDASPILCIAVATHAGKQIIFSGMPEDRSTEDIEGWYKITSPSEQFMLLAFREWCDHIAPPDTTLVGHNLRNFDLPRLRHRYLIHRLRLPEILRPRLDDEPPIRTVDTMHLVKAFSVELRDEKYVRLNQVAVVLGIDRPKQFLTGADVPRLYREGQYQSICCYCAIDALTTARAFLLMTGQASDLA